VRCLIHGYLASPHAFDSSLRADPRALLSCCPAARVTYVFYDAQCRPIDDCGIVVAIAAKRCGVKPRSDPAPRDKKGTLLIFPASVKDGEDTLLIAPVE